MTTYNALLRQIRTAVEARLRESDSPWSDEAIKGTREARRGHRSSQRFFDIVLDSGKPIMRDGKPMEELPFVVYDAFDYPTADGQPGDVRIYCAPLPEARQMLEQALGGGPYESAIFLRITISLTETGSQMPGRQGLTESAFIGAIADEWKELHSLLHPEDEEIDDGSDDQQRCPDCETTTRVFDDEDPEDDDSEMIFKEPHFCGGCGKAIPIEVEGQVVS